MHPFLSWTLFIGVVGAAYVSVYGVPGRVQPVTRHAAGQQQPQQENKGSSTSTTSSLKQQAKKTTAAKKKQAAAGKAPVGKAVGDASESVKSAVAGHAERVVQGAKQVALGAKASLGHEDASKAASKKKDKKRSAQAVKEDAVTPAAQPTAETTATDKKPAHKTSKIKTASWYHPEAALEQEPESPVEAVMNGRPRNTSTPIGRQPTSKASDAGGQWTTTTGKSSIVNATHASNAQTQEGTSSAEDEDEEGEDVQASALQGNRFWPALPEQNRPEAHLAERAFASQRRAHVTDDMLDPDTAFAARTLKIVPSAQLASQSRPAKQHKATGHAEPLTKKQRQNAAKKAKAQAEKEAARQLQEQAFKVHQKQRERERIAELEAVARQRAPKSSSAWPEGGPAGQAQDWQTVNKKKLGAGQTAAVVDGKLIWE